MQRAVTSPALSRGTPFTDVTRSIVTTTLLGLVSQPAGNCTPANPVLVTTVAPSFVTQASAQSVQVNPGKNAPCSIRNLMGSVRPSTSPMYWPVLTFLSWLPLATGSMSAKPRSSPPDEPNT